MKDGNKYEYIDDFLFPHCCKEDCFCNYTNKEPNECKWKQNKDIYGNPELTLPPYSCEEIMNDETKVGNVCYIK